MVPTSGKVFTITNKSYNGANKAGTVLQIKFQMRYNGNIKPTAKITSFVGQ